MCSVIRSLNRSNAIHTRHLFNTRLRLGELPAMLAEKNFGEKMSFLLWSLLLFGAQQCFILAVWFYGFFSWYLLIEATHRAVDFWFGAISLFISLTASLCLSRRLFFLHRRLISVRRCLRNLYFWFPISCCSKSMFKTDASSSSLPNLNLPPFRCRQSKSRSPCTMHSEKRICCPSSIK